MGREEPTHSEDAEPVEERLPWSPRLRAVVSFLVLLHLTAVVVAPLSNPPPASELSRRAAELFLPYLMAADLNHGYRFFAPNPGESYIVRYEVEMPDGSRQQHQFPSVDDHWPRLLYHRHFMISESINAIARDLRNLHEAPDRPLSPEQQRQRQLQWQRTRDLLQDLLTGVSRDLLARHGAEKVELTLVAHNIAIPEEVQEGVPISDNRWYEEQPLGSMTSGGTWTWSNDFQAAFERISP